MYIYSSSSLQKSVRTLSILPSALVLLTACNLVENPAGANSQNTVPALKIDSPEGKSLASGTEPECFFFKFEDVIQRADTLMKYVNKNQILTNEKFFCAFPGSIEEMENLFGFDDTKGAAPLYEYPKGKNIIDYFANLNTISKDVYYEKYINICVNGVWHADNIQEAFGFVNRLLNDTDAACKALSKRTDEEIKSVFQFIFDGPHPNNDDNQKIYDQLHPILAKQNVRLARLLTESYNKVLAADDEHGH